MKKLLRFGLVALVGVILLLPASAFANGRDRQHGKIRRLHRHHSISTVRQDSREFFVDKSKLPFDGIPGLPSTQEWGVDRNAGYRIEVPDNWNGDLVMFTHGFRGEGLELTVDNPPLRAYYLSQGFAWAASSYSANNYDVRSGVHSTNSLARLFKNEIAEPNRIFITGFSMGGHVIGAAIEMFPNIKCADGPRGHRCRRFSAILGKLSGGIRYAGAAPACGVMGDTELFDYFGDFSFAAEALAGVPSQFPPPEDYLNQTLIPTLFALYDNPLEVLGPNPTTAVLNSQGEKLRDLTTIRSGGFRPGAREAFSFFQQLLFSFSGSDGTLNGVVKGNIYDNIGRVLQLDANPALTADEVALNDMLLRIFRDKHVNRSRPLRLERVPVIRGRLSMPVLSIHTVGDLFVPLSMEQTYAREALEKGREQFLVSRVTRSLLHCEFSSEELIETFDDLVEWVDTGVKPRGDSILRPAVVRNSQFGCAYTRGETATRPLIPACRTSGGGGGIY